MDPVTATTAITQLVRALAGILGGDSSRGNVTVNTGDSHLAVKAMDSLLQPLRDEIAGLRQEHQKQLAEQGRALESLRREHDTLKKEHSGLRAQHAQLLEHGVGRLGRIVQKVTKEERDLLASVHRSGSVGYVLMEKTPALASALEKELLKQERVSHNVSLTTLGRCVLGKRLG